MLDDTLEYAQSRAVNRTLESVANSIERKDVKAMKNKEVKNMKWMEGFTLVELLVVISIIAVLLAVMMPALNKARESARSVICRSNLKQIVLAAMAWAPDHGDYVVPGFWYVPSKPFETNSFGEVALCNEAIARGASLEPYTGANQSKKNNLYSCPTAAKFGENLFTIETTYYYQNGVRTGRTAAMSFGVNALAVTYDSRQWLGSKGSPGTKKYVYPDWGENNVYTLEHGKSKLLEIPMPSRKVYFTDFPFSSVAAYDEGLHMYDPLYVCYRVDKLSYKYAPTLTDAENRAPGGAKDIVQARWHGAVNSKTGYGYGDIAWFDGSASKEPPGYDKPKAIGKSPSGFPRYNWHQYWQNPGQ